MRNYVKILENMRMALSNTDPVIKESYWNIVEELFPYTKEMKECIQDSVYHAEGDVWTHNKMIAQHVYDRGQATDIQLLTTLYHDVAKAKTRLEIEQSDRIRVSHPHHSRIGSHIAWADMWEYDIGDISMRIQIYKQIQWHQRAYHIWKNPDMIRSALSYAADANWNDMIEFALCDNLGRISPHQNETIDNLELLKIWLEENKILSKCWNSNSSRLFFFEKEGREHTYEAQRPNGSNVILMSGLPGSGKDTHIETNLGCYPVISLDKIRTEMGVVHGDNQGPVIQAGLELARTYLRTKTAFVWNSTNLTKMARSKVVDLCRAYDAYITFHIMGTPFKTTLEGNKNRKAVIPEDAIYGMLKKWEPVSLTEAHDIKWIIR